MASGKQEVLEWENVSIIGKGGSSTVYKAISKPLGEHIAVKQIDIDGMSKDQLVGIRAEIDTMKSLSHPNIVSYLGMQLRPNKVFILMEFASLGSLRHHYQRVGPFSEKHVRYCLEHIVNGLHYLHSNGIAHRDVKCANCLISNTGVVKLADFGASKKFESQSIVSGLKGTPHWMAPEVIKGTQMTTGWIKADVWSLGCTVVEMFTGKVPYSEYENPMTAMYKIANGELPSLLQRRSSSSSSGSTTSEATTASPSSEVQSFVRLCCSVDPADRPSLEVLAGHAFLSTAAPLSESEVQSFFSAPLAINTDSIMGTPAAPHAAGEEIPSPGQLLLGEVVHEVEHSEMFSPDPRDSAAAAAHLIFSSGVDVDSSSVATFNNSSGGRGGGSRLVLSSLAAGGGEQEEEQYEDDWSDGELNPHSDYTNNLASSSNNSNEGDLSRCVTRQAHNTSPPPPTAAAVGGRLQLQAPSGLTGSSSSADFSELPTPLMGAAGGTTAGARRVLVRYDSDVSIGDKTATGAGAGISNSGSSSSGASGVLRGFEVSSDLVSELQTLEGVVPTTSTAASGAAAGGSAAVLSFDEANEVYLTMMSKYSNSNSSNNSSGNHLTDSTADPSEASTAAAAGGVMPNLSPVKIKTTSRSSKRQGSKEQQEQQQPSAQAVVGATVSDLHNAVADEASASTTTSAAVAAPTKSSAAGSNRFGFSASAAVVSSGGSGKQQQPQSLRSSAIPVAVHPAHGAYHQTAAAPMDVVSETSNAVGVSVVVSGGGQVKSPPASGQHSRPHAPFSGEKLRIHNYSNNSNSNGRDDGSNNNTSSNKSSSLSGHRHEPGSLPVSERMLTGAALRKKAAQELQEAQQASKQHPHQQALLKIKPSQHLVNITHTGSGHGGGSHRPPNKRARHHEKPQQQQQQQHGTAAGGGASESPSGQLNIDEVVRDLQAASQHIKTLRGAAAAAGAGSSISISTASRSHSAGVPVGGLGGAAAGGGGGLGTPQHRNRLPPVVGSGSSGDGGDVSAVLGGGAAGAGGTNALGARYIQSAPAVSRSMNLPPIKESSGYGSKTPKLKPVSKGQYSTGAGSAAAAAAAGGGVAAVGRNSPAAGMVHSTSSHEFVGLSQVREQEEQQQQQR